MDPLEEQLSTITDLHVLRAKRGARKGNISRVHNSYRTIERKPLPQQSRNDVKRKLDMLDENVRALELIQDRITVLSDDGSLEREEEDLTQQRQNDQDLRCALDALLEAVQSWSLGSELKRDALQLNESASIIGPIKRSRCAALWSNHSLFMRSVEHLKEYTELAGLAEEVKPLVVDLEARYEREMEAGSDTSSVASAPLSPASSTESSTRPILSRLKVKLPTFTGELLEWRDFWKTFHPLMDRETSLTDAEKVAHLLSAMQGPNVQREARIAAGAHDTYDKVVARLKEIYDQPRTVYRSHVKNLCKQKTIQYTRSSLRATLSLADVHVNGLERHEGYSLEQYLAAQFETFMAEEVLIKWNEYTSSSNAPPTLDDLRQFLKDKANTLSEDYKPHRAEPSHKAKERPRAAVLHAKERFSSHNALRADSCPLCKEDHSIYQCTAFRDMSVSNRTDAVKRLRICFNCLGRGHSIHTCSSTRTCRECGQRHHSLLHRSTTTSETSSTDTVRRVEKSSGIGGRIVMSRTAVITVHNGAIQQRARAIMDTGADVTLITTRLANSIQAKKIKCQSTISGVTGELPIKYKVKLKLGSIYPELEDTLLTEAYVLDKLAVDLPPRDLSELKQDPSFKGLLLADPDVGQGGRVDILLGVEECSLVSRNGQLSTKGRNIMAQNTLFGWALGGALPGTSAPSNASSCYKVTATETGLDALLDRLWRREAVLGEDTVETTEEREATEHYKDTVKREEDGRYAVRLPKKQNATPLGESRFRAQKRYLQNERALRKKGTWTQFAQGVQEYIDMGHAEPVPEQELKKPCSETYYLPMHGVAKEASTTTKLRVVFDASAPTTSGISLNEQLLPGPSLYPRLTAVITKFRLHRVAMSADISKMFREISLQKEDRDLHRFLVRDNEEWREYRMTRLTFGVTSSPFLATKTLLQMAEDHIDEYPQAAEVIKNDFYVDDCLTGADTVDEAVNLREELNTLLSQGRMTLRKWRSSSQSVLDTIPDQLRERTETLELRTDSHLKTLGIHWDTNKDCFYVSTPPLNPEDRPTKRQIASDVAKLFDVMGWYSPVVMTTKVLLQRMWQLKLDWDAEAPADLAREWRSWRKDLPELTRHPVPRRVVGKDIPTLSSQLHGFSDASKVGYGGVVYLRTVYQDTSIEVKLLTSKTRVAPLNITTIPRLELCGAHLLAKLLNDTARNLNIKKEHIFAWTDSTIVLGWLNTLGSRLRVYVAHRVADTLSLVPAPNWRYVATSLNPADLASRGALPLELLRSELWWQGPSWLADSPDAWPRRPDINRSRELPELKPLILLLNTPEPEYGVSYSSLDHLIRITGWIKRFAHNTTSQPRLTEDRLTQEEMGKALTTLLKLHQGRHYAQDIENLKGKKQPSRGSSLLAIQPFLDSLGVMRVGGRLQKATLMSAATHPIILNRQSHLSKLIVVQTHLRTLHAGPATMLSVLSSQYYICGAKRLVRQVSRSCVVCRKAYARTAGQMMAPLPKSRVTPSPPFQRVGVDFAGPFLCKRGNPRKPTSTKAYACIFVCMATKAVHIELVSDLTTEAFMACLKRFVARRGQPAEIYSDNGRNFVGAKRELQEAVDLIQNKKSLDAIHHYASTRGIDWVNTPGRAPHFGGLWEAAVKSFKTVLKKVVGTTQLSFEELSTVLAEAEAVLNSRPLTPMESSPEDGVTALTPGHFLVGRALCALPVKPTPGQPTNTKRWNLVQHLSTETWKRWQHEYLQTLQFRNKWRRPVREISVGDVVLLKESDAYHRTWPLARVKEVHPGADGHVRVVDVAARGHVYRRPVQLLIPLLQEAEEDSLAPEDVQAPQEM